MVAWSTINHGLVQSWKVYWDYRLAGKPVEAEIIRRSILAFTKAVRT
jgi:hypothetical protein